VSGVVVWLTGLPQSGKSTLARTVEDRLGRRGRACVVLDGDELRPILGTRGHDPAARDDFYARLAALAALFARQGLVVVVPATAHRAAYRAAARAAAPRFVEVHVDTPLADCEHRDVKGLYAAARAGTAPQLPGIGPAYEPPIEPDVVAHGGHDEAAIARITALV
jgi:adenylylsulfate kinase